MAPYPTKIWKKKVYPNLDAQVPYNKMLDDFLAFARVGSKGDFFEHSKYLTSLAGKANALDIVELHYKSKTADLRVPLHTNNKLTGGQSKPSQGNIYSPNIPTEKIFAIAPNPFLLRRFSDTWFDTIIKRRIKSCYAKFPQINCY